jgi:hypothetical protein
VAFTFGGATTDDIAITLGTGAGADNTHAFFAGWFYPTTLTATRNLWSCGNIYGCEVATTTSELLMRTQNATTNGVWTTTGAGITVDAWWFIAWLNSSENTTVAGQWRVWVGSETAVPVAVTVTNGTARSGNYTGSAAWTIGNKGTGSLAFQGDIANMVMMATSSPGIPSFASIGTSGAVAADEEANVLNRWVLPMYRGRPKKALASLPTGTAAFSYAYVDLNAPVPVCYQRAAAASAQVRHLLPTVSGATYSERRPAARLPRYDWPIRN